MDDDFLHELLGGFGPVTIKRMFGGKGILCDGRMIALVAFDTLFVKADAETEERFRAAGSQPFAYRRATRAVTVPAFWTMPEAALDDPDEAARWMRLGHQAALRSAGRAKPKRRRAEAGAGAPVPADLGVAVTPMRRRAKEKV
jgi:DNA transformation protein and related proteins